MSYALRAVGWAEGILGSLSDSLSTYETRRLDAIEQRIHTLVTQTPPTTVAGIVEATNPTGIKLQGGNWLNYSTYGYKGPKGGQPAPEHGQHVVVELDKEKWIKNLLISGTPAAAQAMPAPLVAPHTNGTVTPSAAPSRPAPNLDTARERLMTTTVEVRLKLIGTLAVAQPTLFTIEDTDTVTEIVRNLEQFVLEDLIAATTPESDDDLSAEDLDEDV